MGCNLDWNVLGFVLVWCNGVIVVGLVFIRWDNSICMLIVVLVFWVFWVGWGFIWKLWKLF